MINRNRRHAVHPFIQHTHQMKDSPDVLTYFAVRVRWCLPIVSCCQAQYIPYSRFLCCGFRDDTHARHKQVTCESDVRPHGCLVASAFSSTVYAIFPMPVRSFCNSHTCNDYLVRYLSNMLGFDICRGPVVDCCNSFLIGPSAP